MQRQGLALLQDGIVSRTIPVLDLNIHILEAKAEKLKVTGSRFPLVLLLHGFPELAFSWRKVIVPLSKKGYHVVAPDLRGYGATTSQDSSHTVQYDDDLAPFGMSNAVKDVVALVYALGYTSVAAVVGHDHGSLVAGFCAIVRPDLFRCVVLMASPLTGAPSLPFDVENISASSSKQQSTSLAPLIDSELAALDPPRKHYTHYYTTPPANSDMLNAPQGLHAFLRAYFHMKSADWQGNDPHPLPSPSASALAVLPHYYIMPLNETMPQAVAKFAPTQEEISAKSMLWLTDEELGVYVSEYSRTGFQGSLNSYRVLRTPSSLSELALFSGKRVEVPAMYISGNKDWGVYQNPGAIDKMKGQVCPLMEEEDFVLVDGAGHWLEQEQPDVLLYHLSRFLEKVKKREANY